MPSNVKRHAKIYSGDGAPSGTTGLPVLPTSGDLYIDKLPTSATFNQCWIWENSKWNTYVNIFNLQSSSTSGPDVFVLKA